MADSATVATAPALSNAAKNVQTLHRQVMRDNAQPEHANLAQQALLLVNKGLLRDAEPLFLQSIALLENEELSLEQQEQRAALPETLNHLGLLYLMMKRFDEALPLFERARDAGKLVFGQQSTQVVHYTKNLGQCFLGLERKREAEQELKRALIIARMVVTNAAKSAEAPAIMPVSDTDVDSKQADQATEQQRSQEQQRAELLLASVQYALADLFNDSNRFSEAEPLARASLNTRKSALGYQEHNVDPDAAVDQTGAAAASASSEGPATTAPVFQSDLQQQAADLCMSYCLVAAVLTSSAFKRFSEAERHAKEALLLAESSPEGFTLEWMEAHDAPARQSSGRANRQNTAAGTSAAASLAKSEEVRSIREMIARIQALHTRELAAQRKAEKAKKKRERKRK